MDVRLFFASSPLWSGEPKFFNRFATNEKLLFHGFLTLEKIAIHRTNSSFKNPWFSLTFIRNENSPKLLLLFSSIPRFATSLNVPCRNGSILSSHRVHSVQSFSFSESVMESFCFWILWVMLKQINRRRNFPRGFTSNWKQYKVFQQNYEIKRELLVRLLFRSQCRSRKREEWK